MLKEPDRYIARSKKKIVFPKRNLVTLGLNTTLGLVGLKQTSGSNVTLKAAKHFVGVAVNWEE